MRVIELSGLGETAVETAVRDVASWRTVLSARQRELEDAQAERLRCDSIEVSVFGGSEKSDCVAAADKGVAWASARVKEAKAGLHAAIGAQQTAQTAEKIATAKAQALVDAASKQAAETKSREDAESRARRAEIEEVSAQALKVWRGGSSNLLPRVAGKSASLAQDGIPPPANALSGVSTWAWIAGGLAAAGLVVLIGRRR